MSKSHMMFAAGVVAGIAVVWAAKKSATLNAKLANVGL